MRLGAKTPSHVARRTYPAKGRENAPERMPRKSSSINHVAAEPVHRIGPPAHPTPHGRGDRSASRRKDRPSAATGPIPHVQARGDRVATAFFFFFFFREHRPHPRGRRSGTQSCSHLPSWKWWIAAHLLVPSGRWKPPAPLSARLGSRPARKITKIDNSL